MLVSLTFAAMKSYWRILRFAKPYMWRAYLNAIFNILMILFSFGSIGVVIPLLNILFGTESRVSSPPEQMHSFWEIGAWIGDVKQLAYYQFAQLMESMGEAQILAYICVAGGVMFFFKNFFRYLALWTLAPLRNGVINDIRVAVHRKSLELPISYFTEKRKGDTLSRMSSDVTELQWSFLTSLEMVVRDPLMIIGTLAILIFLSPKLTLFMFIVLPIAGLLMAWVGKSLKRKSTRAQNQLGQLLSIFEETLSGLRIIKAFRAEPTQDGRFQETSKAYTRTMDSALRRKDLGSPINEFLGAGVMFLILWYGGQIILGDNSSSNGIGLNGSELIGYLGLFYQIIPAIKSFTQALNNIQKGSASAERIIEILDAHNPIQESAQPVSMSAFKSEIHFNNVSFRYAPDGPNVLEDINFSIQKGKTIALVGASGSGKTTISNLIPRFWDVTQGSIEIDGVDIRQIKLDDLRGLLGIVNQESILFNDSVRTNIALGKPHASDEEVRKAADVANASEFIDQMEQGFNSNVGEGGAKLSGGQRQRVSIARAVLEDPPILILDEATSALDTESERLVQDALNKLMTNRTSLIIAHRLSTIQHADEILVMDQGKIVERGAHDDLLKKDGVYANLVNMQSFA